MRAASPLIRVGLLAYSGVTLSALYGLSDMIAKADDLAQATGGARLAAVVLTPAEIAAAPFAALDAVVLPPSAVNGDPPADAALLDWLRAQHRAGAVVTSVCVGAFLLGRTGLLDGRRATTHWALGEQLAALCPRARIETERLLIDDGDIVTAAGLLAWVDLGLRLIERFLSPAIMLDVARHFLADPRGREQRFYSPFTPRLNHGDAAVLKAQHWLHGAFAESVSVAEMAAQAGLSGRTFLRRFHSATGLKPNAYLQQLRVSKARELLELSRQPLTEVAWQAGYEDPAAFRKVFQRTVGLSPGEYRRRFGIAAG
ncbi:MAG: helix-turn-helix domain-containing protein [Pseudomonadota bacterium]